jgi:hypothetical protein
LEDRRLLAVFTVTNLDDLAVAAPDVAPGTLRQAIYDANNSAGADEIVFDGLSGTLALEEGELVITEALSINGPGMDNLTIDAQLNSRILNITATTGDFSITGLTLTNGQTTGNNPSRDDNTYSGGAVRSLTSGLLTIVASRVTGSSTTGFHTDGGGIYAKDSTVAIAYSVISGNESRLGGGVMSRGGDISISNSIVENNTASLYGGGVWIKGGALSIAGSIIRDNEGDVGAGIAAVIQELHISESEISGNTAVSGGGGMMIYYGTVTLDRSTFIGNQAGTGGAFQSIGSSITITDSLFSNNTANLYYGGGLRAYGNGLTITGSSFSDNSAKYGGGAIWFDYHGQGTSPFLISHSTVTGNETTHSSSKYPGGGGGVHIQDDILLEIDHSIVAGNIDHNGVLACPQNLYHLL